MALSKMVLDLLGGENYSESVLNEKVTNLIIDNTTLKNENSSLTKERDGFKTEVEDLEANKPLTDAGTEYLSDLRKQVESNYRLLKGESASPEMIKLIQEADLTQLKIYALDYSQEVEKRIPGICSVCGKPAKLVRRSSQEVDRETERAKDGDTSSFKINSIKK
jgi:hypothetical protein